MKLYNILMLSICGLIFTASVSFSEVINPGFEEGTKGWVVPSAVAQIDETTAHSGSKSLRISFDDPAKREFAYQKIDLKPGKRYLVSAWVKCTGVMGAYNGATVGIEHWNAKKDCIGGSTQIGIGYDRDWTHVVFLSNPVNAGTTSSDLYTCIDWGGHGTAWFDDVSVTQIPDITMPKPTVANPKVVGDKDSPDFEVSVGSIDSEIIGQEIDYSVSLCAPPWNAPIEEKKLPGAGKVTFSTSNLSIGEYQITLDIKSKSDGRTLAPQQSTAAWKYPPAQLLLDPHSAVLVPGDKLPVIDIKAYRSGQISGIIISPKGETILYPSKKITAGKNYTLTVNQTPPVPGKYQAILTITSPNHPDYTYTLPFTVLTQSETDRAVTIGRDNLLRDKGKPWFPMFIYAHTAFDVKTTAELDKRIPNLENDLLSHIQGTPFGILDYATPIGGLDETVRFADECAKRNIRLALSVKDVYPNWAGLAKRQKDFPAGANTPEQIVRSLANKLKNNPALAIYYTNDELASFLYNDLTNTRKWLHEEDPFHPTLSVHYDLDYIKELAATYDIFGPELYPPYSNQLKDMANWSDRVTSSLPKSAPFWGCLWHFKNDPQGSEKLKALTYISIAKGAKGLLFYAYYELKDDNNFNKRWTDLVTLGKEIESRLPILLQPEHPTPCRSSNKNLIMRTLSGKQGTWLLAVNSTDKTISADTVLPLGFTRAEEDEKYIAVNNGSLKLNMKPFEVKLVMLQ